MKCLANGDTECILLAYLKKCYLTVRQKIRHDNNLESGKIN